MGRATAVSQVEPFVRDYVFDPNPVFWAFGPQTLRVTLTRAPDS